MTTEVEKSIQVDAPVSTVYDQWTQFEEFPQFMGGITSVTQTTDTTMHWVAEIAGVRREWDAAILEQVPDEKIAWAATTGATNAGAVYFAPVGAGQTLVRLVLEYQPEGLVEQAGDKLGIVEKQAEGDLERFKTFLEARGAETGGWRGEVAGTHVGTPGVQTAASSRGDSGKAGTTTAAKVAGIAAAAVGVAAAAALKGGGKEQPEETVVEVEPVTVVDTHTSDAAFAQPDVPATVVDAYPADDAVSPLPSDTRSL
ncbi:MAG: cyclase/dehydrase [Frankiales bacterium]|nr:cyclase/dehydrase [Frankiales bacterium]